jgi:thymidine phosphorylase
MNQVDGHPGLRHYEVRVRRGGIDTGPEPVVYMRPECEVCRAEGLRAHSRVLLVHGGRELVATLHHASDELVGMDEAVLSESAWTRLRPASGALVSVRHVPALASLGAVRAKMFGHSLEDAAMHAIIGDLAAGRYSDIHTAAFLTACTAQPLDLHEAEALTRAMVGAGETLAWNWNVIADKHCVGGLPGNRTTPIVVAIVAALGVRIPKTSSRAITSPAGTADVMATLTTVDLGLDRIRKVVEREGGCLAWGGAVRLSPADDLLIRIERALDIDSPGQLVASVLSKKIAAGSTHVVLDLPVGPTAKVRDEASARLHAEMLEKVAERFGLKVRILLSDGTQPVGRGIGPALEAQDVLAVLEGRPDAPADLRGRALALAGALLEFVGEAQPGAGELLAEGALNDGRAWRKFQAICEAQGGMRVPPEGMHKADVTATRAGILSAIDNRRLARLAKLAGAPDSPAAGLRLHARAGDRVVAGSQLATIHATSRNALHYALEYRAAAGEIFTIGEEECVRC